MSTGQLWPTAIFIWFKINETHNDHFLSNLNIFFSLEIQIYKNNISISCQLKKIKLLLYSI